MLEAETEVVPEMPEPYIDAEKMSVASTPVAGLRVGGKPRDFADFIVASVKPGHTSAPADVEQSAGAAPVQHKVMSPFNAKIARMLETTDRLIATLRKMRESQST